MPNAATIADAREILNWVYPKANLERERRVDLAITDDGRPRADRAIGLLSDESRPPFDAETVSVEGVDAANMQEYVESVSGSYAPISATFITQTSNSTLTAEQPLSTLSSGLVHVTTGTGVLSTATANTDYLPVASPVATGTMQWGQSATDITQLHGHLKHKSAAPSIAVGVALGTGGSVGVAIDGSDQAGTVTLTAGTTSLTTGTATTITFATARPNTNYSVWLAPAGTAAGTNAVQFRRGTTGTTTWTISFAVAPTSGAVYVYDYGIIEWTH